VHPELNDRLQGLESILHRMHYNQQLIEFLSFNLHTRTFNLSNNAGLMWIWTSLMSNQLIDFYKIIWKDEKFSFDKILNVSKNLKTKINYALLEKNTQHLKNDYDSTNFEAVRSKYLAHQDLQPPEMRTDLATLKSLLK
jgi:hypothetical protein